MATYPISRRAFAGGALGGLAASFSAPIAPAFADDQADVERFYKGKQITFVVGSDPGGGYDLLARLVARRLPQFLPGAPTIVVQNMPGAGSVLMSNLIYNTAPQDGSYIGLVQRGVLISQLTKQPGVRYDVSKFNWVGSVTSEVSLVAAWHTAPFKTIQDLRDREMIVGGTGATADTEASARILNALAGTKLKIVSGYPGTADVMLALQRGELQGIADLSWSEMKSKNVELLRDHDLTFLCQNTLVKAPDLPDVPIALEFIENQKPVAELYYAMKGVARPIMMGPKVPAERVSAMRKAFWAMTQDAGYQQDAAKAKLIDLHPADFSAVDAFIAKTTAATADVAQRLTEILNPGH